MRLFIVRHAIAEERGPRSILNDDRPLSAEGVKKMRENASGIIRIIPSTVRIVTSPLKRAFSTAQIIAEAGKREISITLEDALLPDAAPVAVLQMLKRFEEHPVLMLVGHQPNLGKFLTHILGQKNGSLVLKKGSISGCDYDPAEPLRSKLLFTIPPKMLRMIGSE